MATVVLESVGFVAKEVAAQRPQTSPAYASKPSTEEHDQERQADLRSVGAVFTMTASGHSLDVTSCSGYTTSSSFELSEFTNRITANLLEVACESRHVWFNSPSNSSVAITPYSLIYGVHPRYFHFDGQGTFRLTPVGHMLHLAGLTQALCCRTSRSASPQSRSSSSQRQFTMTRRRASPERVLARTDEVSVASPSASSSMPRRCIELPQPDGRDALELLQNPQKALEVFREATRPQWPFEERSDSLRNHLAEARSFEAQAQKLRRAVADSKMRLARLRRTSSSLELNAMSTLTPEELALSKEIDQLKDSFQEVVREMWRIKADVDQLQHILEEDAAQMQKEFQAWLASLHRRCRNRNDSGVES